MGNANIRAFGANNQIYIQTDRANYVGGQQVTGNIYLNMMGQFNTKGIFLTLQGFEKAKYEIQKTRQVRDGVDAEGNPKFRTEKYWERHGERRQFFNSRMCVHQFQGTINPGQYTFPFNFTLPENLPGNFKEVLGVKNCNYDAEVSYWLEAEADAQGWLGRDILYRQPIIIDEALREGIQAVSDEKTANVTQCCCINKGDATMKVHFDKNCYVPGETAYVICEADNRSTVDFSWIRIKLMRKLELSAEGHRWSQTDVLHQEKFEGVKAETNCMGDKARRVALNLRDNRDGILEPQTSSHMVKCKYWVDVEFDIPYAPDIEIHLPITVYAPQPAPEQWGIQQVPEFWHPAPEHVYQPVAVNFDYGAPAPMTGYEAMAANPMGGPQMGPGGAMPMPGAQMQMQGGMQQQQPMQGGMQMQQQQQPMQGGMQMQQGGVQMQAGMQQPMQGGMQMQQGGMQMQGGVQMQQQQPMQGGMQMQQPMQGGMQMQAGYQ